MLDLYTLANGVLTDVAALSYQIWDNTTGTPVQVYPDAFGGKQPVNVAAACPTGDKLGTGHYVARWDVPDTAPVGTWQVRWYIQLTLSVAEQTYIEDFEVLPEVVGSGTYPSQDYCLVADMREEGVPVSVSDSLIAKRITLASRFIEAATRRFFYPKEKTVKLDGRGGPKLLLQDPIIAIEEVRFEVSPLYPSEFTLVENDIIRVYNRHLSQGLTEPDDRNNPRIELFNPAWVRPLGGGHTLLTALNFPRGQQNVQVKGVFGYTDPDPDATNTQGKTPDLIRHACKLLVMKELAKMSNVSARFDARNRFKLTSERTRDQAYTLGGNGSAAGGLVGASFTGDPEIDHILAYYQRPPAMGAT